MKNLNNYSCILIAGVAVLIIVVAVNMGWFKKKEKTTTTDAPKFSRR
jgi:hypothetical protein